MYGPELGASAAADEDDDEDESGGFGTRLVKAGHRVSLCIFEKTAKISLTPCLSAVL